MSLGNNQSAVRSCGLEALKGRAPGGQGITIALLDGMIDLSHPCFAGSTIVQTSPSDAEAGSRHATFIASMLVGRARETLGLCRSGRLISVPIIDRAYLDGTLSRRVVDRRLAEGIRTSIDRGADVIQLSSALPAHVECGFEQTESAIAAARRRGVRVVVAAGNAPDLGSAPALTRFGCIPVAMADSSGAPYRAPASPYVGMAGLLAPGLDLRGAVPGGMYGDASGSSLAASFVTAAFALLSARLQALLSWRIWDALLLRCATTRSVSPPHLDTRTALHHLISKT